MTNCPTCGQEVSVATSDEGTSHYVSEARRLERERVVEEMKKRASRWDNTLSGDQQCLVKYMAVMEVAEEIQKEGGE